MTNSLIKTKQVTYVPGSPGFPASPGQPWIPAHWETIQVATQKQVLVYGGDYHFAFVRNPSASRYESPYSYTLVNKYGNPTSGTYQYTYATVYEERRVWVAERPYCAPRAAIPATAAQTIIDLNLGWNSGARSNTFITDNGYAEFTAPASLVGAVVGLNDADVDASYANIEHAFYLSGQTARIYELGAETHYVGPYTAGATFRITRTGTQVTYQLDGTTVYTSSKPSTGTVFLDTSLYAGDDCIYDPVVSSWGGGSALNALRPLVGAGGGSVLNSMRPLVGVGGSAAYGQRRGEFAYLTGGGREAIRATGVMPPMTGLGSNKTYGASSGAMAPLRGESFGGQPVPRFAISNCMILPLMGGALGTTGTVGGGTGSFAYLAALASDHAYGESSGSMPALRGGGSAYEGNTQATLYSVLWVSAPISAQYELLVTMRSDLSVATVFALQTLQDDSLRSSLVLSDSMDVQALIEALLRTTVTIGSDVPVFDSESHTWVLNADTGATSRYEDYGFNSFGYFNGAYYGCKPDGLYLLEGDDDAGLPIRAMVDFGKQTFGSSALKSVPNAYIGVASSGAMVLKVIVEGAEYHYTARSSSAELQQQRVDLGRGLRANYFTFQLFNSNGADFTLDSIEFTPLASTRRI